MDVNVINIFLSFIEGIALIISPCILPILPIILASSLTGGKRRPLGIIAGFILTFTLVTLFSHFLIQLLNINLDYLRYFAFAILIILSIIMMSTTLTEKFNLMTQRLANIGSSLTITNDPRGGFWSGMVLGALIGIIWTPCAGPILAAVIVQVVIQKTSLGTVLTIFAFALGAGVPMLFIAFMGREFVNTFRIFRERPIFFRKLIGVLIFLGVILMMLYSSALLNFPSFITTQKTTSSVPKLINAVEIKYPAPPIEGISTWINSKPLQIKDLHGKVVLIDFWTYSCINCIRTLPYLKSWYKNYGDKGLVIIGVHSPEFAFEQDLQNVKNAVKNFGITYPVALDNQFITWQNFHNQYWPAHFLIDKNGDVVYVHFGEGEYDVTENNIRYLLGMSGINENKTGQIEETKLQTPEIYLGFARALNFASPEWPAHNRTATYSYPASLPIDHWALQGKWLIQSEKIISVEKNARILLHFQAGKVFAVMGAPLHGIKLQLRLNGERLKDVMVDKHQLYTLVQTPKNQGLLEITAENQGLEVYTFTFGQ